MSRDRAPLSLGLFGGSAGRRAARIRRALRSVDLHPNLVPEAVKLTAVKLLTEQARPRSWRRKLYRETAETHRLLHDRGRRICGREWLRSLRIRSNGASMRRSDAGTSLDAKLVLLALHAEIDPAERGRVSIGKRRGLDDAKPHCCPPDCIGAPDGGMVASVRSFRRHAGSGRRAWPNPRPQAPAQGPASMPQQLSQKDDSWVSSSLVPPRATSRRGSDHTPLPWKNVSQS